MMIKGPAPIGNGRRRREIFYSPLPEWLRKRLEFCMALACFLKKMNLSFWFELSIALKYKIFSFLVFFLFLICVS